MQTSDGKTIHCAITIGHLVLSICYSFIKNSSCVHSALWSKSMFLLIKCSEHDISELFLFCLVHQQVNNERGFNASATYRSTDNNILWSNNKNNRIDKHINIRWIDERKKRRCASTSHSIQVAASDMITVDIRSEVHFFLNWVMQST